ncbi:uncharacterized protein LOC144104304 [Amblyomma americanum]
MPPSLDPGAQLHQVMLTPTTSATGATGAQLPEAMLTATTSATGATGAQLPEAMLTATTRATGATDVDSVLACVSPTESDVRCAPPSTSPEEVAVPCEDTTQAKAPATLPLNTLDAVNGQVQVLSGLIITEAKWNFLLQNRTYAQFTLEMARVVW